MRSPAKGWTKKTAMNGLVLCHNKLLDHTSLIKLSPTFDIFLPFFAFFDWLISLLRLREGYFSVYMDTRCKSTGFVLNSDMLGQFYIYLQLHNRVAHQTPRSKKACLRSHFLRFSTRCSYFLLLAISERKEIEERT